MIRAKENGNIPILECNNSTVPNTYFNLIKLKKSEEYKFTLDSHESITVVLSGNCDIQVDEKLYTNVGKRKDVWSGNADSVYAGTGAEVKIKSNSNNTEAVIGGGKCQKKFDSFRVNPDDVDMVDVGSNETKSHRQIFHILGQQTNGRTGNLLISELYCDEGCWSGYPPHKHDCDRKDESNFEETYYYRFDPENGFGAQYCYSEGKEPDCFMTKDGDTFAFSKGYHPTVTSPGHREYIFTLLVGITQHSLVQYFMEDYRHLMNSIPGIDDMVAKFR